MAALSGRKKVEYSDTGGSYSANINVGANVTVYSGALVAIDASGNAKVPNGVGSGVIVGINLGGDYVNGASITSDFPLNVRNKLGVVVTIAAGLPLIGSLVYAPTDNVDDCTLTAGTNAKLGNIVDIVDASSNKYLVLITL